MPTHREASSSSTSSVFGSTSFGDHQIIIIIIFSSSSLHRFESNTSLSFIELIPNRQQEGKADQNNPDDYKKVP